MYGIWAEPYSSESTPFWVLLSWRPKRKVTFKTIKEAETYASGLYSFYYAYQVREIPKRRRTSRKPPSVGEQTSWHDELMSDG